MLSELITFDGGLSTKIDSRLIKRNEGIICQNVNLETGVLKPLENMLFIQTVNGKHIYPYNDLIISNQSEYDDRFYDTYGDRLYWSDNGYSDYGLRRYDGTDIGIKAEAPQPFPIVNVPITLTQLSLYGQLTHSSTYTYAVTIVDELDIESSPVFLPPITLSSTNKPSIRFSVSKTLRNQYIPLGHSINIYRTGGDNPTFNLVAENVSPSNPLVIDGDTVTDPNFPAGYYHYVDKIADIDVPRIELTTFENTPPPDNITMIVESKGTMFGAVGKKVHFSRSGAPEYWGLLDYITLDKECTGLGKFGDNILAFTRTSAYVISGFNRDNIVLTKLPFNQGCINRHSIVNIDAYTVWASLNGICMFDGSTIQVLTKKTLAWDEFGRLGNLSYNDYNNTTHKWDSGDGFNIEYAVGYQDKYYGVYNNGVVILDLSNGLKVSTIYVENVVSVAINEEDNFLYVIVSNDLGTYDVYALLGTDSNMTATWKTGRLFDNTPSIRKQYRQVELEGTPDSVEVFIDGISRYKCYNKDKFMLPAGLIGRDIQFEIITTNEIKSMKYQYSQLQG